MQCQVARILQHKTEDPRDRLIAMEFAVALTELSNAHSVAVMAPSSELPEELFTTERAARSTARRTKSSRHGQGFKTGDAAGMNDSDDGGGDDSEFSSSVVTKRQRKRQCSHKKQLSSTTTSTTTMTGNESTRNDAKLERTRQLQNLRQRRYRARKKCSLSELQQHSQQLAEDNARLERAIRAML